MANGLMFSPRKTALALAVAVVCAWQSPVFAHGSEAHMVPLDKTLQAFGADVQWDDYAQMFTLIKDGAYVKVKPGAKTAIVNGKPLDLQVPVVMKEGKAWVSDTFINDVFQSGLDQTFQVEKRPHPLNSLSAAEISDAVTIVKAAPEFQPNTRFTEISLHEPDKAAVWAFALQGTPVDAPRTADVVMLDGKHVIEAVVDLQNKKILSWTPIKGAHGMVLLDDFVSVQNIINASSEFAEVLIDVTDLPIAPAYEQAVSEAGIEIVGKSKWKNTLASRFTSWNHLPMGTPALKSLVPAKTIMASVSCPCSCRSSCACFSKPSI